MTSGQLVSIKQGHKSWCRINRNDFFPFLHFKKMFVSCHWNQIQSKNERSSKKPFEVKSIQLVGSLVRPFLNSSKRCPGFDSWQWHFFPEASICMSELNFKF